MKKRILPVGLIVSILLVCTSCAAVRDVFIDEDPSAYLVQKADQMLTAMHTRFSEPLFSAYSYNSEIMDLLRQTTTAVTNAPQALQAEWMLFDSYENVFEYSYRNGGVFYTAGLPGEMIQSVMNAYGTAYIPVMNILQYQEFAPCPKALDGKRAALMLDYGNACAVFSFTCESAGLLCSCMWVPLAQDGNLTFQTLSDRVASGSSTRTRFSSTEISSLLSSKASLVLIVPEKNTSDFRSFLQSSSLEMVDYMRVCCSSSLLSLKAPMSNYGDYFTEMDRALAGSQRSSTIYTGLNQTSILSDFDDLASYLTETGQSLKDVFSILNTTLMVSALLNYGSPAEVVALYSLTIIQRYAAAPEGFEPSMVLVQCSDRVAVLVTYYDLNGVVVMNGNTIILPEDLDLASFRDELAKYFTNVQ